MQVGFQPLSVGFIIALVVLLVAIVLALPGVNQISPMMAALFVGLALARLL